MRQRGDRREEGEEGIGGRREDRGEKREDRGERREKIGTMIDGR